MTMVRKFTERYYEPSEHDAFVALVNDVKKSNYLPRYHITPKAGLMNDPNGLAYYNGEYHFFFQWYPFDILHGLKHWGHTMSNDLVHWTDQEFALIPDQEFEKNGCYSGNAIEYNGDLYLFYTANYKAANGKIPKQGLAIMDKRGYIKKLDKPIIDHFPKGLSGELRDPFVFERNGQFYMLLGGSKILNREKRKKFGDDGVLLLYRSQDLFNWEYQGEIDLPIDRGYMLECPSMITIDGKDVLLLSPMGVEPTPHHFKNRFATVYLVGQLDIDNLIFTVDHWDELDSGFDFYAPQAFYGKDHLPLMSAWFGCGEPHYPVSEKWKHGLTFTQELRLKDNILYRYPVQSIVDVFDQKMEINDNRVSFPNRYYHLHLTENFNFKIGQMDDYWEIIYNKKNSLVTLSRAGLKKKIDESYGFSRFAEISALSEIDVFVDNSFVEVYLNKGEHVFSFVVFQEEKDCLVGDVEAFSGSFSTIELS